MLSDITLLQIYASGFNSVSREWSQNFLSLNVDTIFYFYQVYRRIGGTHLDSFCAAVLYFVGTYLLGASGIHSEWRQNFVKPFLKWKIISGVVRRGKIF